MKPTFEKTVNVLVQAYLNDTLVHGSCYACAVGNLVAHGLGITMHKTSLRWPGYDYPALDGTEVNGWGAAFASDTYGITDRVTQKITHRYLNDEKVIEQIKSTGYDWQELARIEFAFEGAAKVYTVVKDDFDGYEHEVIDEDKWMFNGLMAVVDVLAEIHNIDLTTKEEAKLLFAKP